jgi:transcriptional regulator with XRE-family HTH domain
MTPLLCRAARAILNWTQQELGESSGTSRSTVVYFETAQRVPLSANLEKMRSALMGAGVRFVEENGEGAGVRMKASSWPAQCRAARGLLGWTHFDVAGASGVSDLTVLRLESELLTPRRATLFAIRRALDIAGVIFLDDDGEGPGVRLKRPK